MIPSGIKTASQPSPPPPASPPEHALYDTNESYDGGPVLWGGYPHTGTGRAGEARGGMCPTPLLHGLSRMRACVADSRVLGRRVPGTMAGAGGEALSVATWRQEGLSGHATRVSATPPVQLGRLAFSEWAISTG